MDEIKTPHKTKSFTLDSGYERGEDGRGRYQIYVTLNRKGAFVFRGKINLFVPGRVKEIGKRHIDKRLRGYGHTLLMSLNPGEVGHHINDIYVIGIPKEVHESMSSNDKDKHRAKALEWLRENNRVKYLIALEVLKDEL